MSLENTEACDVPNIADILTRVSRMQGMILKNYLTEEKISSLRTSIIELQAEQSRISAMIKLRESELEMLSLEAELVKCEMKP